MRRSFTNTSSYIRGVRSYFSGEGVSSYIALMMLTNNLCMQRKYILRDKKHFKFVDDDLMDTCENGMSELKKIGMWIACMGMPRISSVNLWYCGEGLRNQCRYATCKSWQRMKQLHLVWVLMC